MALGLLGKKVGMNHIYDEDGNRIVVTVVKGGPCHITQIKNQETDGYSAVQVGFEEKRQKSLTKPEAGHFKKASTTGLRFVREFRLPAEEASELKLGQELGFEAFKADDKVDVTGFSKGAGFAGVMKRHGFKGGSRTHGTHEYFRHGGSIGCCFPQHTIKGKKMPGRMGGKRVTVQSLRVIETKPEEHLIYIKGAIPGARGGYLMIQKATKSS